MPQTPLASSGRMIRIERERRGMTQTQLADVAGVSQATLSRIEVAGGGRADTLMKLATALDLSVTALLPEAAALA